MTDLARAVLADHLVGTDNSSPVTFCVLFKTRNNNQVKRDDAIKLIASGEL
jgi:hypothetical protein